jgi:hypothetical protein
MPERGSSVSPEWRGSIPTLCEESFWALSEWRRSIPTLFEESFWALAVLVAHKANANNATASPLSRCIFIIGASIEEATTIAPGSHPDGGTPP